MTALARIALVLPLAPLLILASPPRPNPLIVQSRLIDTSALVAAGNDSQARTGNSSPPPIFQADDWIAIQVGPGPKRLGVTWNTPSGNWSDSLPLRGACAKGAIPRSGYRFLTSSNSTDGEDGTWDEKLSVEDNIVSSRAHLVPFSNRSWIKWQSVPGNAPKFDEIEVFDASEGFDDSWFFLGTSITQMSFGSLEPDTTFQSIIAARLPDHSPAIVRAGVHCVSTPFVFTNISRYLDLAAPCHFLAIELGTNDALTYGIAGIANFSRNLQAIVDSAKARGMEPIIARLPSTNASKSGWQMPPEYALMIDSITQRSNLHPGPDFYSHFLASPQELSEDGVHPSAAGAATIHRLWAETVLREVFLASSAKTPSNGARSRHPVNVHRFVDALGRWRGKEAFAGHQVMIQAPPTK